MSAGRLVVMGSGETGPGMVATHREAIEASGADTVVVMDTTFGFQENADELTERLVDFFRTSLQVSASVATLRSADASDLERERFRLAVAAAAAVFAGPGSPSFALGLWRSAGMGELLSGVIRRGGAVVLASAAALTAGAHTLPVYEIYKVGAAPHWLEGLGVLDRFGIKAAIVPHWNNAEGGTHDTSRCFIGERRMRMLEERIPVGVIGVDEHTAATFDFGSGVLCVTGKGEVTIRGRHGFVLGSGETAPLTDVAAAVGDVGLIPVPEQADEDLVIAFQDSFDSADVDGIVRAMLAVEQQVNEDDSLRHELRSMIVRLGDAAERGLLDPRAIVGGFVELLLQLRRDARAAHRYDESDRIREGLADLGVEVRDTPEGVAWLMTDPDQKP